MDNWAIIIGVDHYDQLPGARLKGAVNDALAMRQWLIDPSGGAVPERNLTLLLSPEPGRKLGDIGAIPATRANSITSINRLLERSGETGERFFFYFSGHGLTAHIDAANQSGMAFSDFTEVLTDQSLTVDALFERFQATRFKEQFFFIDGCRNAPFLVNKILGRYPDPRTPESPVSPQFVMYATSPMEKALEVHERGAFTEALLQGLAGKSTAKRWDSNAGSAGEYVIRWSTLFAHVRDTVKARKLASGDGTIQIPRRFGEDSGEDPILGRKPLSAFAEERLNVKLTPKDALDDSSVLVRDLSGLKKREPKPIKILPVPFDLLPRSYGVDVEAEGWVRVGEIKTVDLYEPSEVTIELERLPPIVLTQSAGTERDVTFARPLGDDPQEFVPNEANRFTKQDPPYAVAKLAAQQTLLTVRSRDPLATLEIADEAGRTLAAGRGIASLGECQPGFYRARLVSPEGESSEQLVQIEPGETREVEISAPLLSGRTLGRLIDAHGFERKPDRTISVSESVGPSASLRLSTVLALAAAAAAETESPYGQRLRTIGIPAFPEVTGANSGVQIVIGSDDDPGWIGRQLVSLTPIDVTQPMPNLPRPLLGETAISVAAFGRRPGPCMLRLQDASRDDQGGLALPLAVLSDRMTLVVITRNEDRRISLHLYMLALSGPQAHDPMFRDLQFADSNFAAVRRIELMQRSVISGRVSPTAPEIEMLLYDKWRDPVAGCLGAYLSLRRGTMQQLREASENLAQFFPALPDAHVLRGVVLEQTAVSAAAASYIKALDYGLPMFRDGVALLAAAAGRLDLKHDRLRLLRAIAARSPADPLWSATMLDGD